MRNGEAIKGMRTREQYKVMGVINQNFEPGAAAGIEKVLFMSED